jgi:hypothetical protein
MLFQALGELQTQSVEALTSQGVEKWEMDIMYFHGVTAAVQYCMCSENLRSIAEKQCSDEQRTAIRASVAQVVKTSLSLLTCVMRVHAGSPDTPHASSTVDCRGHVVLTDQSGEQQALSVADRQRLLTVHTWTMIRVTSELLAQLVHGQSRYLQLLAVADIERIGELLYRVLLTSTHKGVIEKTYDGFCVVCKKCLAGKIGSPERKLVDAWYSQTMAAVFDEGAEGGSSLPWIRRSAGLPYVIMALLQPVKMVLSGDQKPDGGKDAVKTNNSKHSHRNVHVSATLDRLTSVLQDQGSEAPKHDWKTVVHCLNILRALFVDGQFSMDIIRHVEVCVPLALQGFRHAEWAVRNSSFMLYISIVARATKQSQNSADTFVQGVSVAADASLADGGVAIDAPLSSQSESSTFSGFFSEFPAMLPVFQAHLRDASRDLKAMHHLLYPILTLLSGLSSDVDSPAELHRELRAAFEPLLTNCLRHVHYMVRHMAAKTLASLLFNAHGDGSALVSRAKAVVATLGSTYSAPQGETIDTNATHGRLLALQHLLAHAPSMRRAPFRAYVASGLQQSLVDLMASDSLAVESNLLCALQTFLACVDAQGATVDAGTAEQVWRVCQRVAAVAEKKKDVHGFGERRLECAASVAAIRFAMHLAISDEKACGGEALAYVLARVQGCFDGGLCGNVADAVMETVANAAASAGSSSSSSSGAQQVAESICGHLRRAFVFPERRSEAAGLVGSMLEQGVYLKGAIMAQAHASRADAFLPYSGALHFGLDVVNSLGPATVLAATPEAAADWAEWAMQCTLRALHMETQAEAFVLMASRVAQTSTTATPALLESFIAILTAFSQPYACDTLRKSAVLAIEAVAGCAEVMTKSELWRVVLCLLQDDNATVRTAVRSVLSSSSSSVLAFSSGAMVSTDAVFAHVRASLSPEHAARFCIGFLARQHSVADVEVSNVDLVFNSATESKRKFVSYEVEKENGFMEEYVLVNAAARHCVQLFATHTAALDTSAYFGAALTQCAAVLTNLAEWPAQLVWTREDDVFIGLYSALLHVLVCASARDHSFSSSQQEARTACLAQCTGLLARQMSAGSGVEDVVATLRALVAPDVVHASALDVCAARVAESVSSSCSESAAAFVLHPKVNALLAQTVVVLMGEALTTEDLNHLLSS